MRQVLSLLWILSGSSAFALPQYQSLFESKYGFKAQCALCHVGGELNSYGKHFAEKGRDKKAIDALETLDMDKDGHLTLEEIQARSNPGYSLSRPGSPGEWLAERFEFKIPEDLMKEAFPQADRFVILKRELNPQEKERMAKGGSGSAMDDADYFAVMFIARQGAVAVGAASYVGVPENSVSGREEHVFLLAVNPNGKILKLFAVNAGRAHLRKRAFLKQFRNLWPEEMGKVKFSKDASNGLKESLRRQMAKYARLIDVILPP